MGEEDGGGGVDLISGLSDDLLLRILGLADASDVVRTDALSRRWRGLWTGVAALRFDFDSFRGLDIYTWSPPLVRRHDDEAGADDERYLAFVDGVLTLRAKAAATTTRCYSGVKDLEISFNLSTKELVLPSFKAAQGWIRYAAQHEVESLVLRLNLLWSYPYYVTEDDDDEYADYNNEDYYDENVDCNDEDYYDENVDYDKNVDYDENANYNEDYYDENADHDEDYDENVDYYYEDHKDENDVDQHLIPAIAIGDLASSAKLETLHLNLSGANLSLPSSSSTVVFSSLADVSLEDTIVAGHLLSRFVSPACCPRLRKLRLDDLRLAPRTGRELLIEGNALLELSLRQIWKMQSLELRTHSLQVLHVEICIDLEEFTVSAAPMLEDLVFEAHQPLLIVDTHGHLSSVETLKIHMYSHGNRDGKDWNDASILLLQCCSLTKRLEVSLEVLGKIYQTSDIIKGRIPSLPHLTSLTVQAKLPEPHTFGASIASFLAPCNNIRFLSLNFSCSGTKSDRYLCDDSCQCKSDDFSLARLQEVEFKWLLGTDCELQFIQSVLGRQTGIQKVTIGFERCWLLKDSEDAFKLVAPLLDGGLWSTFNDNNLLYKWRRCCQ